MRQAPPVAAEPTSVVGVMPAIEAVRPWRAARAPIVSTRPSSPLSSSCSGTSTPVLAMSSAVVASGYVAACRNVMTGRVPSIEATGASASPSSSP